ncbi:MAG: C-terminal binding protein [Planctomycetaceae bacterium]|nr:C-terminal binding protein [Planctomycetaceae bacterium]
MPAFTACFTDTDQDLTPVDKILRDNGIDYVVRQCKTQADLVRECQGFEVLVNQYAPMSEEAFAGLKDLKVVVRYGVGVDHIDIPAATRHGVTICNVPDGCTNEVADHGAAMLLAMARKIVFLNQKVHEGSWSFQDAVPLFRLNTCTLGLIGVGRIGAGLATRMRGFGMRFLGYDEYARQKGTSPDFIEMTDMDRVLAESDFLSIHCPLDGNRDLIGAAELAKMKKTAGLINVSRGGIVNEDALYDALKTGVIGAAAFDVSSVEPMPADSKLLTLDNFICTPHMAYYSVSAAADIGIKAAEEVVRYAKGQPLRCALN